ncbi:MAG: hypothetical protein KH135_03145 [Firmicutes bacterium]|nr:hypothetical protein [Bacillota bacterium]
MNYIWKNDISYFWHKHKGMFFLLFLIPYLLFLLYFNTKDTIFIYRMMFGIDLKLNSMHPLEVLMYLFQISFYLYLMALFYMKDIETQLDTIFLRMRPQKWFFQKTVLFIMLVICLKLISYGIPILVLSFMKIVIPINTLIILFLTDTIYIVTVIMICLTLYIVSTYSKWSDIFSFLLGISFLFLFPKNISACTSYHLLFLGIDIGLLIFNMVYIKRHDCKLIQKVGGI